MSGLTKSLVYTWLVVIVAFSKTNHAQDGMPPQFAAALKGPSFRLKKDAIEKALTQSLGRPLKGSTVGQAFFKSTSSADSELTVGIVGDGTGVKKVMADYPYRVSDIESRKFITDVVGVVCQEEMQRNEVSSEAVRVRDWITGPAMESLRSAFAKSMDKDAEHILRTAAVARFESVRVKVQLDLVDERNPRVLIMLTPGLRSTGIISSD